MDTTIEKISEWKEKAGKWDVYKDSVEKSVSQIRIKMREIDVLLSDIFPDVSSLSGNKKPYRNLKLLYSEIIDALHDNISYNLKGISDSNSLNYNQKSALRKTLKERGFVFDGKDSFIRKKESDIRIGKISVMG